MKKKKTYTIEGMHCASCAMLIEGELEDLGISGACSFAKGTVEAEGDSEEGLDAAVMKAVEAAGYKVRI